MGKKCKFSSNKCKKNKGIHERNTDCSFPLVSVSKTKFTIIFAWNKIIREQYCTHSKFIGKLTLSKKSLNLWKICKNK